jgi:hypothetical protein
MGWEGEGSVQEVVKKKVVGEDGVHLSHAANLFAAVSLCHRLSEMELVGDEKKGRKKQRRE